MKKSIFICCLLLASVCANAQFEKGKWVVSPSVTGLDLSHNSEEKTTFGFMAHGGAFLEDNLALLVTLGANWSDAQDTYTLGVGGRYYLQSCGVYLGLGMKMKRWDPDLIRPRNGKAVSDYALSPEVGYAFFITRSVTIEPAVYYDISFKNGDYSRFGLKVGFGIYF